MKATHAAISRGLAKHAASPQWIKVASLQKEARRRWLEDPDLIKLCKLFRERSRKNQ